MLESISGSENSPDEHVCEIFVLALSLALDPVGALYSVRGKLRWDPTAPIYL